MGPFDSADLDGVRTTVDLNLVGTMICIKHAVPAMKRAGGGSIIGMSSGAGHFPHRSDPDRFADLLIEFVEHTVPAEVDEDRWRELLRSGAASA